MQNELLSPRELLDEKGLLTEEGWARRPLWRYDRKKINAPWHRIKEWDYYAVISHDHGYGITFTISDLSYIALTAVCWLDFNRGDFVQLDTMKFLTRGNTGFPPSSGAGDIQFRDKTIEMSFKIRGNNRILTVDAPSFAWNGQKGLAGEITLFQDPAMDSMTIATSWENQRKAFYYNQKINCMPAEGTIKLGNLNCEFSPPDSMGCLDWGRGNWTYKNRWYWGSLSAIIDGKPFGLNLGYGFSDRSSATENVIIFDGKVHKLGEVVFHLDESDYMKPWKILDDENRLDLDFIPVVDRNSAVDFRLIKSIQHQVFGRFSGKAVLDSGESVTLDNVLGFAEDVYNQW